MKKTLKIALFFSLLGLFSFLFAEKAIAQTVSVSPSSQAGELGSEISVNINILNVSDLYGFQFNIGYNSSILEFVSLTRGTFIGAGSDVYWVNHTASPGSITNIAATRTTPGVSVSGSGTLVTLTFRGAAEGISQISISGLRLSDPNANLIPSTSQNGEISVQAGDRVYIDLRANGSNGPLSLNLGDSATLSWTSSNAESCTASGSWSGLRATSGSETVGPFNSLITRTYTLVCTGRDQSAQDEVSITIQSPENGNGNGGVGAAGFLDSPVQYLNPLEYDSIEEFLVAARDVIFYVILICAPLMILVGAFYIVTAGGDAQKAKTGKNIILYSAIALAIAILAAGIVALVRYIIG